MMKLAGLLLFLLPIGCATTTPRFTPAAEAAQTKMTEAQTREEASRSKRELLFELLKAGNSPIESQKIVSLFESHLVAFHELTVERKLEQARADLYAGQSTAVSYVGKVLSEIAADPWYPPLGEESALLLVTLAEKVDGGQMSLTEMSYEVARRTRELVEAKERRDREKQILENTQKMAARPQVFFLQGGAASQPPGPTREQQLIMHCAGHAVDFVTGRCM